jgi:hypothetical protein
MMLDPVLILGGRETNKKLCMTEIKHFDLGRETPKLGMIARHDSCGIFWVCGDAREYYEYPLAKMKKENS